MVHQKRASLSSSRRFGRVWILLSALLVVAAACSDTATTDAGGSATTTAGATTTAPELTGDAACAANKAAGKITYVSGFDYAASPAILDIVVAKAKGYFDQLCLDVDVVPGFAPSDGPLVIAGQAQFGSADSFGEMVKTNISGQGDLVAIAQYGKTSVQALLVPADGKVKTLNDLPGTTMGIKGDIPYSLQSMLALAGVKRSSFHEILLDGFDPVVHLSLGIDSLPVYKSNEPVTLDRKGIKYRLFDPLDYNVPASFGILFTSQSFNDKHPQAVRDFLRASYRAFNESVADPDTAVGYSIERINAAGNPNFLFVETERPRWSIESGLVTRSTPAGQGAGVADLDKLGAEIDTLTKAGVFTSVPDWHKMVDAALGRSLYDGTTVRWRQ
jgi:NitT/TauT family transport system substrate-binding protein